MKISDLRLNIPLDLPGHSFIDQLKWLEEWAHLQPSILTEHHHELATAWETSDGMEPVIERLLNGRTWDWPEYAEYVEQGGFTYKSDKAKDMAQQVYSKFRSNRNAIYRLSQMGEIKHLRPFWQLIGPCAGETKKIFPADDKFWESEGAPWNCQKLGCTCRVHSLTRTEFERETRKL